MKNHSKTVIFGTVLHKLGIMCLGTDIAKNPYGVLGYKKLFYLGRNFSMKTTSRKRLLISSVAMLLVAMLALGTATFAWFTQNTSATANEFSAKTVKASELKLSSESIDWTDTLNYGYKDKVLKPVSTVDGINWFTAVAANKDSYATTKALAEKVESANVKNFAIVDELNIQNQGGAAVEKS